MPVRGCGLRIPGGVYFECRPAKWGRPLQDFLIDPPVVIDKEALGISNIGTHLVPDQHRAGVYHVLDVVGAGDYPNVLDFYRETKRHGASRRASAAFDFEKLTPESRLLIAHDRAFISNWTELRARLAAESVAYPSVPATIDCLTRQSDHREPCGPMCVGLWSDVVVGGVPSFDPSDRPRTVTRKVGEVEYEARHSPERFVPRYECALFLSLPLTHIVVVRDLLDPDKIRDRIDRLRGATTVDVEEVDE